MCSRSVLNVLGRFVLIRCLAFVERLQLSPAPSSTSQYDEAELMQQWFDVVHEKNVLAGYESELVIQSVLAMS